MEIGVLGVNHKTADLALREEIARNASDIRDNPFLPYPIVLLSTCNRTEIYFNASDLAIGQSYLLNLFRKQIGQAFYSFFGVDCFFHLCRVAAGLDSAILAESEIQRQVRTAYAHAKNLPSCMHFLFQKALKISKEIRSKQLRSTLTLFTALWQLVEWKNRKILLVGNSQINRGLISFLLHKKIANLTLCTRNPARANIEGIRIGDRSLLRDWQQYQIIVCAAKSDTYLISGKAGKTQVIFDLSVPRNVDPKVKAKIYNIEEIDRWIAKRQVFAEFNLAESFIWQNVIRLTRIYRAKTRRVLENAGRELHLECSLSQL